MDQVFTEWSPRMETGLPDIDAQHRRLFELAASFDGQRESLHVMTALAELADYIKTHFRDEEAMLAEWGYPDLAAHRALHAEFRKMLSSLLADARQMSLDQIAERVHFLINDWFYKHILVSDFEYVARIPVGEQSL